MSKKLYPETDIQNIANAIRTLNGSSDTYTVSEMASAIALPENAYYLKESASANPLSITDGEELKCQSALVTFAPKQSGTGDPSPSNIRPISGWDSLVLNVGAINVLPTLNARSVSDYGISMICDGKGKITVNGTSTSGSYFTFTLSSSVTLRKGFKLCLLNTHNTTGYVQLYNGTTKVADYLEFRPINNEINISDGLDGKVIDKIRVNFIQNATYNNFSIQPMIVKSDLVVTEYIPYITPTTHTATFPDTVYGGVWKATEGKAIIDKALFVLDSEGTTYTYNSTNKWFSTSALSSLIVKGSISQIPNAVCENYKPSTRNIMTSDLTLDGLFTISSSGSVLIRDLSTTDIDVFKTRIAGVKLAFPLATPQEITLTPETIELLKGSNTVWTDGDTVQLEYWSKSNTVPLLNMLSMGKMNISNINNENNDNEVEEIPVEESKESLEEIENIDNSENE